MKSTVVIIPTYNERQNLMPIVVRLLNAVPETHVLIVDDNSPDGTGALADDLAATDQRVHALHRADKQGLGAAYQAGFRWALDRGYEQLVEMDGDGSHQPEQLHRLLRALEGSDLALGSRWVPGGAVKNWPARRAILSRCGSLYARTALGLPFRDITGGYRAFRREALETIDLPSILSQGYCFQIDMLWHIHSAGLRIAEVPITFVERRFGVSKMSSRIVREAIIRVTLWGLRSLPSRLARQGRAPARQVEEPAHVGWS